MNLKALSAPELLRLHGSILAELRQRNVCRTSNNPVADYTEWLVASCLNLELIGNSNAGYDAVDKKARRYQIKGRRLTASNGSTQLSAIRNLGKAEFDFLLGVMFNEDYSVAYAFEVPHQVVLAKARYYEHTNSHLFFLRRTLRDEPGVRDIADRLSTA
ncbi:MAG: DUF6998 domain-containing protein [Thermoanaerobaculia bacterium]